MSIVKYVGRYIPTCDLCGDTLRHRETEQDAEQEMSDSEWKGLTNVYGEWKDFCPFCQEQGGCV